MAYTSEELDIFEELFYEELDGFEIEIVQVNPNETIYIINDSLCILFLKQKYSSEFFCQKPRNKYEIYAGAAIIELSPNEIGNYYEHSLYLKKVSRKTRRRNLEYIITYEKFIGFNYIERCLLEHTKTIVEFDSYSPKLRLSERFNRWPGIRHNYLFCEFESKSGSKERFIIGKDNRRPLAKLNTICRKVINYGEFPDNFIYRSDLNKLNSALKSWSEIDMKSALELHLTYFEVEYYDKYNTTWTEWLEKYVNVDWDVVYKECKKENYQIAPTRWVSEFNLYELVKKQFPNYRILYQHNPLFLTSSNGGRMSYDIYISEKKIAIEYQGKQHFEPIDFFGGEESYIKTVNRDKEKLKLSKENGISVIYFNYWESINKETLLKKLEPFDL
ncbi:hypothetical protein [Streptococcus equinus]|uniref:hypothetical protein n=1 Tax=Streptococcus equinus TaxID=1335 RepID=UPI0008EF087F|nr:hypothetical protein [Streptococcus equinus]SFQ60977.1 hypothetical protein SAMN05216422_0557 [Streptococcus equinus]